jgi:hypothetical protein
MKRRSKVIGKRPNEQGRKLAKLKRRAVQTDPGRPLSFAAVGDAHPDTRELNEAREQLAATSEILHAISSSRGEAADLSVNVEQCCAPLRSQVRQHVAG